MKYAVILVSALPLHGAIALAQEEAGTAAEPTADGERASTQPPEPQAKKRSPYYRKA
jgi:hypothetical protein